MLAFLLSRAIRAQTNYFNNSVTKLHFDHTIYTDCELLKHFSVCLFSYELFLWIHVRSWYWWLIFHCLMYLFQPLFQSNDSCEFIKIIIDLILCLTKPQMVEKPYASKYIKKNLFYVPFTSVLSFNNSYTHVHEKKTFNGKLVCGHVCLLQSNLSNCEWAAH